MTEPLNETATLALGGGNVNAHLLVIENGSSSVFALPRGGSVVVGRAAEVELRVEHASVSRRHAQLVIEGGALSVEDLGSHNGTRVNGEQVDGPRALASGDVVMVGDVVIVVHGIAAASAERRTLTEPEWRRRLNEEVARALEYGRPLAVTVLARIPPATRSATADAIASALRIIDVVGCGDDGTVLVLQPELTGRPADRRRRGLYAPAYRARSCARRRSRQRRGREPGRDADRAR
jgi:two-component system response regulator AtoC